MSAEKLEAALRVVRAAEAIFYVDGDDNGVESLLTEALRSASQEFSAFSTLIESGDGALEWQECMRAHYRARLALELATFVRDHGSVHNATDGSPIAPIRPLARGRS